VDENLPGETGDPTELYYPGVALRALDFVPAPAPAPLPLSGLLPVSDVGGELVYSAVLEDREAPASPVYGVTVRVPAPGPGRPTLGDVEQFLGRLKADFLLRKPFDLDAVPGSGAEDPESGHGLSVQAAASDELAPADGPEVAGDAQEADDDAVVEIELALLQVDDPDATYGVVAVIEGAIPADDDVRAVQTRTQIPSGSHLFFVPSGKKMLATVTSRKNVVRMFPPDIKIYFGKSHQVVASQVKLSNGGSGTCVYRFVGAFNGPVIQK